MARASMIISSALWGTTWGALSSVTLVGQDRGENVGPRTAIGLSVGVSAAAIWVSSRYTARSAMSGRRVRLINLGGFMGSSLGLGLPYLFDVSDPRIYIGSLIAGGVTGVIYAAHATADLDLPDEEEEEGGGEELQPAQPEPAPSVGLRMPSPWISVSAAPEPFMCRRPLPFAGQSTHSGDVRYGLTVFRYAF